MLSSNNIRLFVNEFGPRYYKPPYHNQKNVEDYINNEKLNNGIIDKYVVAWKAGRLSANTERTITSDEELNLQTFDKGDHYLNGYGRPIDKKMLDKYLTDLKFSVQAQNSMLVDVERNAIKCFSELYSNFLEIMPKAPTNNGEEKYLPNFGTVYLINLIYFRSKGKLPIYDQFAHKAVKALYANVSPADIYIGPAPEKEECQKVSALYREYLWLLNKVFGNISIGRSLDQSLWVYGHKNIKFEISDGD